MRSNKGQFIVEGMIAMGIIVSSVLGIFSLAISSLRISSTVTNQFIAANLAAEGLEVTKNILDSNVAVNRGMAWNTGFGQNQCFEVAPDTIAINPGLITPDCSNAFTEAKFLRINSSGLYNYDLTGDQTIFQRWVETKPINDLKIRAIATVAWHDRRNQLQTSQIATDFLGWRAENE